LNRFLITTFLVVATALLSGCGGASSAQEWEERWGGPVDLYETVFTEMDCAALQEIIVAEVEEMGQQLSDVDRRDRSAYIQAAFHQMVALACPQAFQ
jgi:hypothetical protein